MRTACACALIGGTGIRMISTPLAPRCGMVEPPDTDSRNCLPAGLDSKAATYSARATADPPDRRRETGETTSPHEAADGRGPGLGD